MDITNQGIVSLENREALRLKAYQDSVGIWTVGYGSTIVDGVRVKQGDTITKEKAEACLRNDVKKASSSVNTFVKVPLTPNQFDALVSFVYNVGTSAFEHSTLLRYLNAGKYKDAASQLLVWVYAGGKVIPGLINRRKSEYQQFNT
jgi:lysozyme